MYRRHKGRIEKLEFVTGRLPNGRAIVHDHWCDVGQDIPPTRFDRALMAMRQMENKKQTNRPLYEKVRQIAIKEM